MTHQPAPHHLGRALALAGIIASLLLVSCGAEDDGTAAESATSDGSAADSPAITSEVSGGADDGSQDPAGEQDVPIFSESEFAPVCRGTGLSAATAFDPTADRRPVVVLSGEDPDYGFSSVQLPPGWQTEFGSFETTQLVVCLDRAAATEVELCEGYEDEDSGVSWTVKTHDTSWAVTLREATTAQIVAKATFDVATAGCPMFSLFTEGDPDPVMDYTEPGPELEVFLKPHVDGV